MAYEQISVKVTEETKKKFRELLETAPGNSQGEKFDYILSRAIATQAPAGNTPEHSEVNLENYVEKADYDNLLTQLESLTKEKGLLESAISKLETERDKEVANLQEALRESNSKAESLQKYIDEHPSEDEEVEKLLAESRKNTDIANAVQLKYDKALESIQKLTEDNERMKDIIANGNSSEYEPDELTKKLLELTVHHLKQKHPEKYKNLVPKHLLRHQFLAYTILRHAEIFWDFVVTDKEILAAAHEVNPEFTSLKQLEKYLFT